MWQFNLNPLSGAPFSVETPTMHLNAIIARILLVVLLFNQVNALPTRGGAKAKDTEDTDSNKVANSNAELQVSKHENKMTTLEDSLANVQVANRRNRHGKHIQVSQKENNSSTEHPKTELRGFLILSQIWHHQ